VPCACRNKEKSRTTPRRRRARIPHAVSNPHHPSQTLPEVHAQVLAAPPARSQPRSTADARALRMALQGAPFAPSNAMLRLRCNATCMDTRHRLHDSVNAKSQPARTRAQAPHAPHAAVARPCRFPWSHHSISGGTGLHITTRQTRTPAVCSVARARTSSVVCRGVAVAVAVAPRRLATGVATSCDGVTSAHRAQLCAAASAAASKLRVREVPVRAAEVLRDEDGV